jgi:hypothetical protein
MIILPHNFQLDIFIIYILIIFVCLLSIQKYINNIMPTCIIIFIAIISIEQYRFIKPFISSGKYSVFESSNKISIVNDSILKIFGTNVPTPKDTLNYRLW